MKARYIVVFAGMAVAFASITSVQAKQIGKCSGGNRAERKVTCLVDGDTGWERGVKWRLMGVDTPERAQHADCRAERRAAAAATDRLQQLMRGGYRLIQSGRKGRYGRILVRIRLKDGRDAGQVLIREGLAQRWPNSGNPWC